MNDLRAAIIEVQRWSTWSTFPVYNEDGEYDGVGVRPLTGEELADAILALPEMVELRADAAVGRWVREHHVVKPRYHLDDVTYGRGWWEGKDAYRREALDAVLAVEQVEQLAEDVVDELEEPHDDHRHGDEDDQARPQHEQ